MPAAALANRHHAPIDVGALEGSECFVAVRQVRHNDRGLAPTSNVMTF